MTNEEFRREKDEYQEEDEYRKRRGLVFGCGGIEEEAKKIRRKTKRSNISIIHAGGYLAADSVHVWPH